MKFAAIASLSSVFAFGCATQHDADVDDDDDTDTIPSPSPTPSPQPTKPTATGAYNVRTTYDLTIEALLPAQIESMVVLLRDFSQHPAQTMFDLAEDAGVPAVSEVRDALPSYVEDKLYGWIDGEIAKITIDGIPVTQYAANIAALAQTSLGKFAIDSKLVIENTTATHTLGTLDLSPAGIAASFPLPLPAATATCSSANGELTIGSHGFSIEYGEYVWQAIDAQVHVRATLGAAVNCPALASTVSNKCYFGVCVGHASQLTAICEAGLDELVDRVHAEFTAERLDLVQLDQGHATLTDADHMTGAWSAQINAGMGLRPAPATFTASR
jgi:hypothetical protein